VVVDYSLRLKRELAGPAVWVAGYSNEVMAYIPSLRVLREGGYGGNGGTHRQTSVGTQSTAADELSGPRATHP